MDTCEWYDVLCALKWLADEIKYIFLSIFESILGGFAYLLEQIPVPDFMQSMIDGDYVLPDTVLYWTDFFELPYGLTVFATALTLRFILRRIPVIG